MTLNNIQRIQGERLLVHMLLLSFSDSAFFAILAVALFDVKIYTRENQFIPQLNRFRGYSEQPSICLSIHLVTHSCELHNSYIKILSRDVRLVTCKNDNSHFLLKLCSLNVFLLCILTPICLEVL